MLSPSTFAFLRALKKNNRRDWFEKNKDRYLAAKEDMEGLLAGFIGGIAAFDKTYAGVAPKDCLFRIYRDVRFSKDKSPYKTHLGASVNPGGRKMEIAGYYLHLEPGEGFLAGGRWMPSPEHLKKIRQEIDYNGKQLRAILNGRAFKKMFGGLDTEYQLSRPPKGYDKDHPDIGLLKMNSYIVWRKFSDKDMLAKNFAKELTKSAKVMKPFLDFLNTAIM